MAVNTSPFSDLPQPWRRHVAEILSNVPAYDLSAPTYLVRSTYHPEPSSYPNIRDSVSSTDKYIEILEAEISKFQLAIVYLQSRLTNICTYKSYQHSLLSPIRRLPDEILTEIFTYACQGAIDVSCSGTIWSIEVVCVRWQRIIRSIPTLWNTIDVQCGGVNNDNIGIAQARVHKCLKFSDELPLSLYFPKFPAWRTDFPTDLYTEIVDNAYRWGLLRADGILLDTLDHNICRLEHAIESHGGFGQLRELEITTNDEAMETYVSYYLFRSATALEVFKLVGDGSYPLPDFGDENYFPLANIKRLHIEGCKKLDHWGDEDVVSAFGAMSSLETLVWRQNENMTRTFPEAIVTLPSLRVLAVQDSEVWGQSVPIEIWPMLRMPSINTIRFIYDIRNYDDLLSMIKSSGSVITRLSFEWCDDDFFEDIVHELSDVEEISLLDMPYCCTIAPLLIWSSVTELLPSLRKVHIRTPIVWKSDIQRMPAIIMAIMETRYNASMTELSPAVSSLESMKWTIGKHWGYPEVEVEGWDDFIASESIIELGMKLGIEVDIELNAPADDCDNDCTCLGTHAHIIPDL